MAISRKKKSIGTDRRVLAHGVPTSLRIGGRLVKVAQAAVGYNFQSKRLLVELEVPLPVASVDVPGSSLSVEGDEVVLLIDTAEQQVRVAEEAERKRKVALLRRTATIVAKALGVGRKPILIVDGLPRLVFTVTLKPQQVLDAAATLAPHGLLVVGDDWDAAKERIGSVAIYAGGSIGQVVALRMDNPYGNHDNNPKDLADAVQRWSSAADGRVLVVNKDTLVLQPSRLITAKDAASLKTTWASISFEAESAAKVTSRLIADAKKGQCTHLWWD